MFPHAGGDYVYLREAFHPAAGLRRRLALVLRDLVRAPWRRSPRASRSRSAPMLGPAGRRRGPARRSRTVVVASALNYASVRWSVARQQPLTRAVKLGALACFVLAAPFTGAATSANLRPLLDGIGDAAARPRAFALALSPVLFSYLGWNASVYVASEIRDPRRNVPRSLFVGLGLCAALYLLMNAVYLYALPVAGAAHAANAGEASARVLFGDARRASRRRLRAALDPRHAERHDHRRPRASPTRWRSTTSSCRGPSASTPTLPDAGAARSAYRRSWRRRC